MSDCCLTAKNYLQPYHGENKRANHYTTDAVKYELYRVRPVRYIYIQRLLDRSK